MALIRCPECHRSISDKALACPHCGYPLRESAAGPSGSGNTPMYGYGYEYKSSLTIFGMPFVHIVYGPGPGGRLKPAKGFIAIGNVAIGVIAVGGFALGLISIAGVGLGLISLAGMAIGILGGAGGFAVGYVAVGGIAIGVYSIGGLAIGTHTIYNSPELREFIRSLLGRS
jgi:hypothetical protein